MSEDDRDGARQAFLESLIANVPGAVYRSAWDREYALELISDEIERISGHPVGDFNESRTRTIKSIIHPDDLEDVLRQAAELEDDGEPFVLQYRIVRADGSVRRVLDRGQLVHGPGGRLWMDG